MVGGTDRTSPLEPRIQLAYRSNRRRSGDGSVMAMLREAAGGCPWWSGLRVLLAGCSGSTGNVDQAQASASLPPSALDRRWSPRPWSTRPTIPMVHGVPPDGHLRLGKGQGLPLVVLFHGGALSKGGSAYPGLPDLVASGAVVMSADWTDRAPAALLDMGESLDTIVARGQQTVDEMACAVDFAVRAAEVWGGSEQVGPRWAFGGSMTSMLGLGPTTRSRAAPPRMPTGQPGA